MSESEDIDPRDDPDTAALLREQEQERSLHHGARLLTAARAVAARLPDGPVCLLSRNAEGTAICAAAVAFRTSCGTVHWDQIALHRPYRPPPGHKTFFVDAVALTGSWLQDHLERQVPEAVVIDGLADAESRAALAA
jgi:hypothetical protein